MATDPPILTYTLEEVLTRFEQKVDRQFTEINQKMDRQFAEVNQKIDKQFAEVNQKIDKQFAEVNQKLEKIDDRLNKLEVGQAELSGEIKALDEKISGIDKRLENQEFINRSIFVGLIVALVSGAVKLLGFFPNIKSP
jgi:predicted nuclease with TOPRIM domain